MKKLLMLVAATAVLVVGCRAEVNVLLDVNEDGSGSATFEFGLDEEFLNLIEDMGGSPDELWAEMDLAAGEGTPVERTEGDMTYTGVQRDFDDISEITSDLQGEINADAPFSEFSFEMDEEQAELNATVSAPEQDLGDVGLDPSMLTGDIFSANFILAMPGSVTEHNADEVLSDGRLKWALPLLGGEKQINARSEIGGSSLWWLWIILGVVLIVGAIAVIAAIILGRRQSKEAVEDAASQYPQPIAPPQGQPTEPAEEATAPDESEAAADEADAEEPAEEPQPEADEAEPAGDEPAPDNGDDTESL